MIKDSFFWGETLSLHNILIPVIESKKNGIEYYSNQRLNSYAFQLFAFCILLGSRWTNLGGIYKMSRTINEVVLW